MEFDPDVFLRPQSAFQTDTVIDGLPPIDLQAELARIEAGNQSADAYLLSSTHDVPLLIQERGKHGMRVRALYARSLAGKYKIRFPRTLEAGPAVMLVEVYRQEPGDDCTWLWLRYIAGFAKKERKLLEFLLVRQGLAELPLDGLVERENGWFYQFPAENEEADLTGRTLRDRAQQIQRERRNKDERAAVRVMLRFTTDYGTFSGIAYNVSKKGLFILGHDHLPAPREEITVIYPLPHGGPHANLRGKVTWATRSPDGESAGGFGVEIFDVEDGAAGNRWVDYAKDAARYGGFGGLF